MLKTIIEKTKNKEGFTKEENDYLFGLIDKMDNEEDKQEIRELLVQGNIGLSNFFLQELAIPPYLYEDMAQEAIYALIKAVRKFDGSKEAAFSTFASKVIRCHLHDCRREYANLIHIPPRVYRNAKTAENREKYIRIIEKARPVYFDQVEPSYLTVESDMDDRLIRNEEFQALKKALSLLPEADRELLFDRYLDGGSTYEKIALKHHKSLSYVYRRLKELCAILREMIEDEKNHK